MVQRNPFKTRLGCCYLHVCWLRRIHLFLYRWWRTSKGSRLVNRNGVIGTIVRIGGHHTHALNDTHAGINTTKYCMLAIEPGCRFDRNKELRPVGIGSRIRHGYYPRASVFEVAGNLVFKLALVYGLSAPSRSSGIATLNHEISYDAMKYGAIVVSSVCESGYIVAGSRGVLVIQFHAKGSLYYLLLFRDKVMM
jgi:hypothetical protein